MIRIIDELDPTSLIESYLKLEANIKWFVNGHKGKQAGLQYINDDDPWDSAVGRSKGNELSYTNLNPSFKGTLFEELIDKYSLTRTRFMWVGPYSCYSMHRDSTPRIHVPLVTNPECYFVFKAGLIKHMPLGAVYRTNTLFPHTFMNCSEFPRLHIVGVVAK